MCIRIPEEKDQEDWHWVRRKLPELQEVALLEYQLEVGHQLQVLEPQVQGLADDLESPKKDNMTKFYKNIPIPLPVLVPQ
jgi:hypothetical protein